MVRQGWGRDSTIRLLALLPLAAVLIALASDSRTAFSQTSTDTDVLPYVSGHIVVKPKEGLSASPLLKIEKLNGGEHEKELPLSRILLADIPPGLTAPEAVKLYEASSVVEYAGLDGKIFPDQECSEPIPTDPDPTEPGYVTPECVDSAPEEPPPDNPPTDQTVSPESGLSGFTPKRPNDPEYSELHGLDNTGSNYGAPDADIDAPEAWASTTGNSDTVVAVLDTGIDITHPDLNDNIWINSDETGTTTAEDPCWTGAPEDRSTNGCDDDGNGYVDDVNGWDFFHNDATVFDAADGEEHGSHVAGTIAARGDNGLGTSGVNWRAKIMPLKFIGPNAEGGLYGSSAAAAEALRYAVAEGAAISNSSWGCYYTASSANCYDQNLAAAINEAEAAGHLFVTSAGNRNKNTDLEPHYPSGYDAPNIVSVAAANNRDDLWTASSTYGSNYGAGSVDLAAPGSNIYSTVPGYFDYMSGTSTAAPHVAGAAALLKSESPEWGYREMKERIFQSADKKDSLSGRMVTGGRLNAANALGIRQTGLSMSASPLTLTYGSGVTVSGKLTEGGQPVSGKQIVLEKRSVGDSAYSAFALATTAQDGTFSYSTSYPVKHTDYRAVFDGEREISLLASESAEVRASVRVAVSLSMATTTMKLGRTRAIAGYVSPNHQGRTVTVTIRHAGRVIARRYPILDANSRYYTTFKPRAAGYYGVFVQYAGDSDHLGNTTPSKVFRVVS